MIERIKIDKLYRYKYKGELLTATELAALPNCTISANCVRTRLSFYFKRNGRIFSNLDELISVKRQPGGWGKRNRNRKFLKVVQVELDILDEWIQQSPPPESLREY